jgi:hypothetical protein
MAAKNRHFNTLAKLAQEGHGSIVALCLMYEAVPFDPPERDKWNAKIIDTIGNPLPMVCKPGKSTSKFLNILEFPVYSFD